MKLQAQNDGLPGLSGVAGISRTAIVAVALSLAACGGGSDAPASPGSQEPSTPNSPTNPQPPSSSDGDSLNSGLTGRVVTSFRDLPVELNLATGDFRFLPLKTIQDTLAEENLTIRGVREYFTSNTAGSGYVQTVQDCYFNSELADVLIFSDDSCIAVFDSSFERRTVFRTRDINIAGAAKLSRSGKYLAFNEFERPGSLADTYSIIRIVDVDTREVLESYSIPMNTSDEQIAAGESPFSWGPNDELVYSAPSDDRVTIYITNPASLTPARTINLPASYQGEARSLALSPDGGDLLIGYQPEDGILVGSVLLLDLTTLGISIPVVDARDANTVPLRDQVQGNILSPGWSPDGQHIMVVKRGVGGAPIFDADGNASGIQATDELYAVPANASRTVINGNQATQAIVIRAQDPADGEIDTLFRGDLANDIPYFDWVQ